MLVSSCSCDATGCPFAVVVVVLAEGYLVETKIGNEVRLAVVATLPAGCCSCCCIVGLTVAAIVVGDVAGKGNSSGGGVDEVMISASQQPITRRLVAGKYSPNKFSSAHEIAVSYTHLTLPTILLV